MFSTPVTPSVPSPFGAPSLAVLVSVEERTPCAACKCVSFTSSLCVQKEKRKIPSQTEKMLSLERVSGCLRQLPQEGELPGRLVLLSGAYRATTPRAKPPVHCALLASSGTVCRRPAGDKGGKEEEEKVVPFIVSPLPYLLLNLMLACGSAGEWLERRTGLVVITEFYH